MIRLVNAVARKTCHIYDFFVFSFQDLMTFCFLFLCGAMRRNALESHEGGIWEGKEKEAIFSVRWRHHQNGLDHHRGSQREGWVDCTVTNTGGVVVLAKESSGLRPEHHRSPFPDSQEHVNAIAGEPSKGRINIIVSEHDKLLDLVNRLRISDTCNAVSDSPWLASTTTLIRHH